MKIARVTKTEIEPKSNNIDPYEVFVDISREYGVVIGVNDIKKELDERF